MAFCRPPRCLVGRAGTCDGPQPSNEDLQPREGTGLRRQKTPVLRSPLWQLRGRPSLLRPRESRALGRPSGAAKALCAFSVGAQSCAMGRGMLGGLPPSPPPAGWGGGGLGGGGLSDSLSLRPFPPSVSFPRNQLLARSPWQGF